MKEEQDKRTQQQILVHATLHPPQQERPQDLMESLDSLFTLLLFLHARLVLVQKTIQIGIIHEYLRTYKVQQRKQLFQAVLQRGPSDEEAPTEDERPNDL